jgi:hypothetical protein
MRVSRRERLIGVDQRRRDRRAQGAASAATSDGVDRVETEPITPPSPVAKPERIRARSHRIESDEGRSATPTRYQHCSSSESRQVGLAGIEVESSWK